MDKNSKIDEILTRGIVNVIPNKNELKDLLLSDKKLNIYLGIDPTATKIHIGHTVPLRKLQMLAELGHNITFLIGDFTALIGDTSDKDKERPNLTYGEIQENFKTYKSQAEKILDYSIVNVVFNSEWLQRLTFEDIVKLTQHFSLGDFVGRTLIRKRLDEGKRVGLHEMLYPVMQGYDSLHLDTDIQIGAADQTFNMQAGRTLIRGVNNKESFVLVNDYLVGTDGRKMSKTWGNAIWLEDSPEDMFGKVMSISDDLIEQYFTLATNTPISEIVEMKDEIINTPMIVKKKLAKIIVSELHSNEKAEIAQNHFEKTFQDKDPNYDTKVENKENLLNTISDGKLSKSQAKRLISEGAVKVNSVTENNPSAKVKSGDKIKVGNKTFIEVL